MVDGEAQICSLVHSRQVHPLEAAVALYSAGRKNAGTGWSVYSVH